MSHNQDPGSAANLSDAEAEPAPAPQPAQLRHSAFLAAASAQPLDPEAEAREPVRILVVCSSR